MEFVFLKRSCAEDTLLIQIIPINYLSNAYCYH
jgi:hypothetical protein